MRRVRASNSLEFYFVIIDKNEWQKYEASLIPLAFHEKNTYLYKMIICI
jgi:hypothetical protein